MAPWTLILLIYLLFRRMKCPLSIVILVPGNPESVRRPLLLPFTIQKPLEIIRPPRLRANPTQQILLLGLSMSMVLRARLLVIPILPSLLPTNPLHTLKIRVPVIKLLPVLLVKPIILVIPPIGPHRTRNGL